MQNKSSVRHFHITIRKIKKNADDVVRSQEVEHVTLCLSAGGQHNAVSSAYLLWIETRTSLEIALALIMFAIS